MSRIRGLYVLIYLAIVGVLAAVVGVVVCYADDRTDANVKELQCALIERGFLIQGDADGIFGPKTDYAVRQFQFANNLKVDGVVGKNTCRKLNIPYKYLMYFEAFYKTKTDYAAVVDTSKCIFRVYQMVNGGDFSYWILIREEPCCVGRNNKTPRGSFTIWYQKDGFWNNEKYYAFYCAFTSDYGFHSVPISEDGVPDNSCLGHHVSAGCVRLRYDTAEWVQKTLPMKTKVYVY